MTSNEFSLDRIPEYSKVVNKITGEFVKIISLVDVPIIIWRFEIYNSVYRKDDNDPNKNYMKILFSYQAKPESKFVTGTSSYYLIADIEGVQEHLPIRATITHRPLAKRTIDNKIKYAYVLS